MISKPNLCNMKQGWEILPFEDCIVKVKYTTKIPNNDYLKQGLYPIISQEEGLVSGYWNNVVDVFKIVTPVVIFGDHTRILKYVDFDFVLGADGVKILQPIKRINAKFFKLYLESCKIPSLGYSRHYKLLKELQVPVPPLAEQERIVAELDCLSSVIEKKKQQLKELDALAQSIFYEMFGDPITNEKGWEVKKWEDVLSIVNGRNQKTVENPNGEYPIYGSGGVMGYADKYLCPRNTVIIGRKGNINKPIFVKEPFWNVDTAFGLISDKINVDSNFLYFFCRIFNFEQLNKAVTIPSLTKSDLLKINMVCPPLPLQQSFASKIEAIEKQKELIKQSIKEVETLFNSRMDYYFN